jgi:hypothetical protein
VIVNAKRGVLTYHTFVWYYQFKEKTVRTPLLQRGVSKLSDNAKKQSPLPLGRLARLRRGERMKVRGMRSSTINCCVLPGAFPS